MNRQKSIILVDDDDIIVYITKRIVAETKLVDLIKVFGNGQQILNYLTENANNPDLLPDIILLDLFMPVMDGWQFLEEYKAIKPMMSKSIIIYIITSSVSPEDITRAKNINEVSDYIVKPISKSNFIEIIERS